MSGYHAFASYYDRLTQNVNYQKRADYLCSLFSHFGSLPTLLLDAACGTGSLSVLMAGKGMEVIGVDASAEMLNIARQKAETAGEIILFLNQTMETLDLFGTINGAVCTLDSLNHLTTKKAVRHFFERVSLFLEPGCLFIFDINTPYKHIHVLKDNAYILEAENLFCAWQNFYKPRSMVTEIRLDFFERLQGNNYYRASETFFERAYTEETLREMLVAAGFEVLAIYNDFTLEPAGESDERHVYVCKKFCR